VRFYAACVVLVVIGAVLAFCDWQWIRRPWFAVLLVAGLCGGLITTEVSPFNFADGGYYMQGLLVAAGAALALAGYVLGAVLQFALRHVRGRRP
jgi:fluoride ion exporter CrcB/FEX